MSKFYTPFPFPIEELKKLLPKGSFFEGAKWNKDKHQLELHWEHDPYGTGLDYPVEFVIEFLNHNAKAEEETRLPAVVMKHAARNLNREIHEIRETETAASTEGAEGEERNHGTASEVPQPAPGYEPLPPLAEPVVSGQVRTEGQPNIQSGAPKRKAKAH